METYKVVLTRVKILEEMSGRKKDYPCLKCNKHVKKNDKAIQCSLCDQWIHKDCESMDDATFDVLVRQVENNGGTYWNCKSCRTFAAKFDKRMKDIDRRLVEVEDKANVNAVDIAVIKTDIKQVQEDVKKQKCDEVAIQENAATSVFSELNNRNQRRLNIIVHGLVEPDASVKDLNTRITKDKEKIQQLMSQIEVDLQVNDVVKFAKRLGAKSEQADRARPLLLGLKSIDHKERMLDNASKLNDMPEPWKSVSIVQDLTTMQRSEEKKMREEAQRLTDEQSDDDKKNWLFKVVGRRGERRILKVPVLQAQGVERRSRRQ